MQQREGNYILTINAGSSSLKLACFEQKDLKVVAEIAVTEISQPLAKLVVQEAGRAPQNTEIAGKSHKHVLAACLDQLGKIVALPAVIAIGHRIVHGGQLFAEPTALSGPVLDKLAALIDYDPEHLPAALSLIEELTKSMPQAQQVACFDTGFYRTLPQVARQLSLPRSLSDIGLQKYGFHGLSYSSLLQQFSDQAGVEAAQGRVIMAHLGSGASVTALKNGQPQDTTMAFTPASGIPMSTRSGDIDPGIVSFLFQKTGMTVEAFNHMVHFESGLLGVSGYSGNMKQLIDDSDSNVQAAEAVELFCYAVRKTIGAFTAVLGGLDSLIFTGGIGEQSSIIRMRVCQGLEYLGLQLDESRNKTGDFLISSSESRIGVHVLHTNEAKIIAQQTLQIISM